MKFAYTFSVLLSFAVAAHAQESNQVQPAVTAKSTLVQVPVLVKSKKGEIVFQLTADDFLLTDNGALQHPTLDEDSGSQPLALAIVVQTGGAGARHLSEYRGLDSILDAMIGNIEHRVAIIGFDSAPHVAMLFAPGTIDAAAQLATLDPGDQGAAILDGVVLAAEQLQKQPKRFRRAILLLSETIDQSSKTRLGDALRLISNANIQIYSFAFSSTKSAVSHEASKLSGDEPGPPHGCFSRDGANSEYDGHYNKQVLDCISLLAPPLRLATMAFLTARNSLQTNTAESVAQVAGGEFHLFQNAKTLKAALVSLSNDITNYYVLSFTPTAPTAGLHALHVETAQRQPYVLISRGEYWIDTDAVH